MSAEFVSVQEEASSSSSFSAAHDLLLLQLLALRASF